MFKIFKIIFLLAPLFIFSQKKIEKTGKAQGVIFETKNYNRKEILCYAKAFEKIFQEKYPEEFSDFVRQYNLNNFNGKFYLFATLIPIEKSYSYKWRYEQYHGRARDVRLVNLNITTKELSGVDWFNVDE